MLLQEFEVLPDPGLRPTSPFQEVLPVEPTNWPNMHSQLITVYEEGMEWQLWCVMTTTGCCVSTTV